MDILKVRNWLVTGRALIKTDTTPKLLTQDRVDQTLADMLRYDAAYFNPKYPGHIVTIKWRNGPEANVTPARWHSFSANIQPHETEFSVDMLKREAGEWYTYRHVGPRYTLVKITLADFLAVKKFDSSLLNTMFEEKLKHAETNR